MSRRGLSANKRERCQQLNANKNTQRLGNLDAQATARRAVLFAFFADHYFQFCTATPARTDQTMANIRFMNAGCAKAAWCMAEV